MLATYEPAPNFSQTSRQVSLTNASYPAASDTKKLKNLSLARSISTRTCLVEDFMRLGFGRQTHVILVLTRFLELWAGC